MGLRGSEDELNNFLNYMNNTEPTLYLTVDEQIGYFLNLLIM